MSRPDSVRLFIGDIPEHRDDDEIANDAVQLTLIATFNGLCRLIAALARNGLLASDQLANIEDAMTAPLDDPDWRDDSSVVGAREAVEKVLARALSDAKKAWDETR